MGVRENRKKREKDKNKKKSGGKKMQKRENGEKEGKRGGVGLRGRGAWVLTPGGWVGPHTNDARST